jgi:hypothetical protein
MQRRCGSSAMQLTVRRDVLTEVGRFGCKITGALASSGNVTKVVADMYPKNRDIREMFR